MLYEVITVAAIQDGETDPIGDLTKLISRNYGESLLRAIKWMLEPNAKDRPQSVQQVLEALGVGDRSAPGQDTPVTVDYEPTQKLEQMADTGTTWKPEVLKTVEVNLERHIGPLSKA